MAIKTQHLYSDNIALSVAQQAFPKDKYPRLRLKLT
jgi:hypothetical protein